MPHFDNIYEIAADNYGIVTFGEAQDAGVTSVELRRFVKDGRLEHLGHGVYKLSRYIPTPFDHYAVAVALVGTDACIHGESVLAMHNLALANPVQTSVATQKRVRKKLPAWIKVVKADKNFKATNYEGIPSQSVADALRYCKGRIMQERLIEALDDAAHAGLINKTEEKSLRKVIEQ